MKRFVFYVTRVGRGKYGGAKEFAKVYQVKKNDLECVGETRTWCTASYMSRSGEVNSFLLANKLIPKTWSRSYDGSLTEYYKINEKYEIKEI
jgi:ABC-type cobalt transport system substrate-binding protein